MDLRLVRLLLLHPVEPPLNLDKHLLEAKSFCLLQFYSSWTQTKISEVKEKNGVKTKIQFQSKKSFLHTTQDVTERIVGLCELINAEVLSVCRNWLCSLEKMVFFHVWSLSVFQRSSKRKGSRTVTYYIWMSEEKPNNLIQIADYMNKIKLLIVKKKRKQKAWDELTCFRISTLRAGCGRPISREHEERAEERRPMVSCRHRNLPGNRRWRRSALASNQLWTVCVLTTANYFVFEHTIQWDGGYLCQG